MSVTVPASVLAALGGLTGDDPPVVVIGHMEHAGQRERVTYAQMAIEPPHEWKPVGDQALLLPASAPALLRVLARHQGMALEPGEVPRWFCTGLDWVLQEVQGPGERSWLARSAFAVVVTEHDPPMEALAAVLVHVAKGES